MAAFAAPLRVSHACIRSDVHRKKVVCSAVPSPQSNSTTDAVKASSNSAARQHLPEVELIMPAHQFDTHPPETYASPLLRSRPSSTFTAPDSQILRDITLPNPGPLTAFLRAGPRKQITYPVGVRAAVVSCGGLCPGINTVIRELTLALYSYGADKVYGVRHGFRGFYNGAWTELSEDFVAGIHHQGGSVLGSSRGGFDLTKIVDNIQVNALDQVFIIGGDGTVMGCKKIFEEVQRRGLRTAIVSIPKTIDNDIAVIDRSFGFETAVDEAQRAINAAHVEATAYPDCIGIVKLMGRNSGFIACHASYASRVVDICLVPEEPFVLRGEGGVLEYVSHLLDKKGSCVLVVAEGAGHDIYGKVDIGLKVVQETKSYFAERGREISTKYLDPTYQIRAIPTTTHDNMLCVLVAHAAVHSAFAGYTGFCAGPVNGKIAIIPLYMLAGIQQKMDIAGTMWQRLKLSTGQPDWVVSDEYKYKSQ